MRRNHLNRMVMLKKCVDEYKTSQFLESFLFFLNGDFDNLAI